MIDKLSSALRRPGLYRLFSESIIRGGAEETYLADYLRPAPGDKVLDIGCGPGDVLALMPEVDYTGLDISEEYVEAARARFGDRGRFYCADIDSASLESESGTFDLAVATGVVHHLDDQRANKLFELAATALRPGGRFITRDGCYVDGQSPIARWMLNHDRGDFVRTEPEYVRLASATFARVEAELRYDLLRVPYTHLVMACYA